MNLQLQVLNIQWNIIQKYMHSIYIRIAISACVGDNYNVIVNVRYLHNFEIYRDQIAACFVYQTYCVLGDYLRSVYIVRSIIQGVLIVLYSAALLNQHMTSNSVYGHGM